MNPDTAEMAAVPSAAIDGPPRAASAPRASEPAGWDAAGAPAPVELRSARVRARARAWWRSLAADEQRMHAVRDCARAVIGSRALVWVTGAATLAVFGHSVRKAFDPPALRPGLGWLGNLLAAPTARWDSEWYLLIARHGYRPDLGALTAPRAAFFPLYPLGLSGISRLGVAPVLAGVLLSTVAFALALYGIHRLTALEFARSAVARAGAPRAREVARLAVLLTAFAPMALFFSAVYSEALFLALSVGVFWSARHGRWATVALLGALASATRSTGLMLLAPALILYLYGPREDRPPDRPEARAPGAPAGLAARAACALTPRYRPRRDLLWLALVPAGFAAYAGYLALAGGDPLAPFHAQSAWGKQFAGPFGAVWDGAKAGFEGLRQLLSLQTRHVYFTAAGGSPIVAAEHNLLALGFLAAALVALVGVLRALPLAYGVYVIAALAMPLSYRPAAEPLMSLPRYLLVLFPLTMWLAGWLAARPRTVVPALGLSALLMAFFAAQFAAWHWVA
jgi:mannosyltransferase PIG-V